jgi:hypothetical protein
MLGALSSARSHVGLKLWRGRAWHERACQAFEFGGPDVIDRTTASLFRREPSRAATGWPGRQDEAPDAELLAVLDQGLEPTLARG